MGNDKSRHLLLQDPHIFVNKLQTTAPGGEVYHCSFERWINGACYACGFADTADYDTNKRDLRGMGFILKPDNTDGRWLQVHRVSTTKILIEENRTNQVYTIYIPACFTSGKIPQRLRTDCRSLMLNNSHQQMTSDGLSVIGCHGDLVVVQTLDRKQCFVPEFYFINTKEQKCVGKFSTKDSELIWYECYVSPDQGQVVLRPDLNTCEWSSADAPKVQTINDISVITMKKFADSGGHVITYDNRYPRNYVFRAKDKDIQLFDMKSMEVVQTSKNMSLPAQIRQLKSSPGGDYLAVRCVFPAFSVAFQINTVAIVNAHTLEVIQQFDSRGKYWPITEAVNLCVFPRFSACDTAIALMKHGSTKRKVYIYKLPLTCTSLQQFCRRTIRRLVFHPDVSKLPIPTKLQEFLLYL